MKLNNHPTFGFPYVVEWHNGLTACAVGFLTKKQAMVFACSANRPQAVVWHKGQAIFCNHPKGLDSLVVVPAA